LNCCSHRMAPSTPERSQMSFILSRRPVRTDPCPKLAPAEAPGRIELIRLTANVQQPEVFECAAWLATALSIVRSYVYLCICGYVKALSCPLV
jgi:hypothetical protein